MDHKKSLPEGRRKFHIPTGILTKQKDTKCNIVVFFLFTPGLFLFKCYKYNSTLKPFDGFYHENG